MGPVLFYCVTVSAAVGCIYFLLFSLFHRREKALEGKSKVSHSVHSPYFTDDKQEFWWCYIADRKSHALITPPIHVTGLVEREEVELKFTAPAKPGKFYHKLTYGSFLSEDITLDPCTHNVKWRVYKIQKLRNKVCIKRPKI